MALPQPLKGPGSFADFDMLYEISGDEVHFKIEVLTAKGKVEKEFVLVFEELKIPKKPGEGFQGVVILGAETTDNLTSASDAVNQVKAQKSALIFVPSYGFGPSFKLSGLMLREKYAKATNDPFGVVFTQLKAGYTSPMFGGKFTLVEKDEQKDTATPAPCLAGSLPLTPGGTTSKRKSKV